MRRAAVVAAALALSACNQTKIDVGAIQVTPAEVQQLCTATAVGYVIWEANWSRKVKPATLTKIRAGYAAIGSLCANPPASAPEVLGSILKAVQAYSTELSQATQ